MILQLLRSQIIIQLLRSQIILQLLRSQIIIQLLLIHCILIHLLIHCIIKRLLIHCILRHLLNLYIYLTGMYHCYLYYSKIIIIPDFLPSIHLFQLILLLVYKGLVQLIMHFAGFLELDLRFLVLSRK
jgi:hypothetical protein